MKRRKKEKIIPYTAAKLRWHLQNNVMGLTDYTIDNIIATCQKVNDRKLTLSDDPNIGCTVAEMLDDLRIEYRFIEENDLQRMLVPLVERTDSCILLEELDKIINRNKKVTDLDKRWYEEKLITLVENMGYALIKHTGSLPELEKIEAFQQSLTQNPYQLRLIA